MIDSDDMDTLSHTKAAALQVDEKPFSFERLPEELRLEVYDHLIVRGYKSLFRSQQSLYYEACRAPVALLCVNRFFNQ